jgi:hypothetical protein
MDLACIGRQNRAMTDRPEQRPEGALLQRAMKNRLKPLTAREAAPRAGIGEARWRQIINGYTSPTAGTYIAVIAPAATLARMAAVVGVTVEQLEDVGRGDAAEILRQLPDEPENEPESPDLMADLHRIMNDPTKPQYLREWARTLIDQYRALLSAAKDAS